MTNSNRTEASTQCAQTGDSMMLGGSLGRPVRRTPLHTYRDIDTIRIVATPGALRSYGIPARLGTPAADGYSVQDEKGKSWRITGSDAVFPTAARPSSAEERAIFIDVTNAGPVAGHMGEGRLALCVQVAAELRRLSAPARFAGTSVR